MGSGGDELATDLAPVTPSVLRWARESVDVSLDDAARRAGVSPERVASWETGDSEPTVAKLRALAKLYQRPLSVFFLPEPPTRFDTLRDFRRPAEHDGGLWSRSLHKVFRRALDQQDSFAELLQMDDAEVTASIPTATQSDSTEEVAERLREVLGVTMAQQISWRSPEEGLAGWIEAVENLGVLVLRTSEVLPEEMRGFSISGGTPPVIVINALDWPRGQVFTLLHEVAHLTLREGGLCDLLERESGQAGAIEAWCNRVASAALMPRAVFLDDEIVSPTELREWDEDVLDALARRYVVSREAVVRRLVTLRRASWDFYLERRRAYLQIYAEQREQERERRRHRKGGPPPYRMTIRDRGKPYVRTVLDAYQRESITASSASRLLSLKLRHFPALEDEVQQ
jgi:Zn-dependent peptidase ImmA (M78 family)/DNA-binding XRE family transcriptional regulator